MGYLGPPFPAEPGARRTRLAWLSGVKSQVATLPLRSSDAAALGVSISTAEND